MDGGLDLLYSRRFGWQVQYRLQSLIRTRDLQNADIGDTVAPAAGIRGEGVPSSSVVRRAERLARKWQRRRIMFRQRWK
jgi:hypothetical protein